MTANNRDRRRRDIAGIAPARPLDLESGLEESLRALRDGLDARIVAWERDLAVTPELRLDLTTRVEDSPNPVGT